MKVLILAAGYGTRLYPLTKDKPKPLLPINGRPLVDFLLDKLKNLSNITNIVVVTNHKFVPHFEAWAAAHPQYKDKLIIVDDGTLTNEDRLGSVGDINFVLKKMNFKEDMLVLGGDNLFDEGLDDFVNSAEQHTSQLTVGVYDVKSKEEAKKFGVVGLDSNKKISSFEEKPAQPASSLIGMCLYYFPSKCLGKIQNYLDEVKKSDTSGDFVKWLSQREDVYAFTYKGKWFDIGSLEAYSEAQKAFSGS